MTHGISSRYFSEDNLYIREDTQKHSCSVPSAVFMHDSEQRHVILLWQCLNASTQPDHLSRMQAVFLEKRSEWPCVMRCGSAESGELYILSLATTLWLWVVTPEKRAARTLRPCPWSVAHLHPVRRTSRHAVALYGGSKLLKFNVFVAVAALIKGAIHNTVVIEEDKPINSQRGRLTHALKWQISSLASLRVSLCFQLRPTTVWRDSVQKITRVDTMCVSWKSCFH